LKAQNACTQAKQLIDTHDIVSSVGPLLSNLAAGFEFEPRCDW